MLGAFWFNDSVFLILFLSFFYLLPGSFSSLGADAGQQIEMT